MENSNNDRWSLLATDLGIETNEVKKSNEVEKETIKVAVDDVVKDAVVAVSGNSVAEHSATEQPRFTTSTNIKESGHQGNLEQKNKFNVSASTGLPYNSSGNAAKPVAVQNMKQTNSRSNFGAGILEPVESDHENNFTKDKNDAVNTSSTSQVDLFDKGNVGQTDAAEINVTKNQSPNYAEAVLKSVKLNTAAQQREAVVQGRSLPPIPASVYYNYSESKSVKPDTNEIETVKPEPVKRSFFGRLQQINFFGSRNKNDNTSQNTDDDIASNEYRNVGGGNGSDIDNGVKSEREHSPHGRYLPPHAQSLYKSHTQSASPVQPNQQNNQYQDSQKETPDLFRQIASQIGKLAGNSASDNSQNRTNNFRYKKSAQDYNYTNTADKTNRNYSDILGDAEDSTVSLFDDDLQETEEFAALRRLIGDDLSAEDEEQRRLNSILGEPRNEPQPEQQPEPRIVDDSISIRPSRPTQPSRVSRYPNNRRQVNNDFNTNTKPNHSPNHSPNNSSNHSPSNSETGGIGTGNSANKRWTTSPNNLADKPNVIVRGRRGSRFVNVDQKTANNPNANGTNRTNTPYNSSNSRTQQPPYQSYQSANDGQVWQANNNNEHVNGQGGRSNVAASGRDPRRDQNWRGRRQLDDKKIVADEQNDSVRYEHSHYPQTSQSQQQYPDYSSQMSHG
ncbi:MAG: hypothetical protein LBK06_02920, partial [Planctomycetaceae bacterium]|nr:hypothetical protein [Planctomycetaceae bacterium]